MIPHNQNLAQFLTQSAKLVDQHLDRIIPSEKTEPRKLHQAIRWSLFAGGKRFRPALVLAAGKTFGADSEMLLNTAAAIEMIHTYSLIHDDLPAMDNDDMRRGKESCHIKFDDATAILAGDVLQAFAFQIIAEDENLDTATRSKLVSLIARAAGTPAGMAAGQQLDLDAEGETISIEELEIIHRSKTGALFRASAMCGAIIAGAAEEELDAVTNYAEQLGLLFQITDDLLDLTQTTEVLGKTAGKDISAEKATYPAFYGVEAAKLMANNVCQGACRELEKINRETSLFREIAEFILARQK